MNITSCMYLASNLGAKQTIARINKYEYLIPKNKDFFIKIGVGSIDLSRNLWQQRKLISYTLAWMRQYWNLLGGAFFPLLE